MSAAARPSGDCPILYIANKNYSSWSLRPWVLMRELGIPFEERLRSFGDPSEAASFRRFSPSGKVPCLIDGPLAVWDSLAIIEYLAERYPRVWPEDARARAWARCASAEMHSGFSGFRSTCSMSVGLRVRMDRFPEETLADFARLSELWREGLRTFGGPFLAGARFTAVDAFFAPVAFRIRTYSPPLDEASLRYARMLLDLSSMRTWFQAAIAEDFRDAVHETEQLGEIIEDLRVAESGKT